MKRFIHRCLRIAPLFAMLVIAVEIVVTTQLAGSGKEVRALDMAIEEVRQENEVLALSVASASSLLTIHARAAEMGFVEPTVKQTITMDSESLPVAFGLSQ